MYLFAIQISTIIVNLLLNAGWTLVTDVIMTKSILFLTGVFILFYTIHMGCSTTTQDLGFQSKDLYCVDGVRCNETCASPYKQHRGVYKEREFESKFCETGSACFALVYKKTETRGCQDAHFKNCYNIIEIEERVFRRTRCYLCYDSNCDAIAHPVPDPDLNLNVATMVTSRQEGDVLSFSLLVVTLFSFWTVYRNFLHEKL